MKNLIRLILKKLGYHLYSIKSSNGLIDYIHHIEPQYQPIVLENLKIFLEDQNYLLSLKPFSSPFDIKNPIPWFSFAAIEFINSLDLTNKTIFEYGCGLSTLYWAPKVKSLVGVENNPAWYNLLNQKRWTNTQLVLQEDKNLFAGTILLYPNQYDIIVIDALNRLACVEASLPYLADGGIILIDDAQRYHKIHQLLLKNNFFYVNFNDFKAGTPRRHALAIYMKNNGSFNFKQKDRIDCVGKYDETDISE